MVATGQRKVRKILVFFQGQGKVRKICKAVKEVSNTKKVREKSGNFLILAQNWLAVACILSILSD